MNGRDKRKNSLSQEQFESIAKRAAEVAIEMARPMVDEVVRNQMRAMHIEQGKTDADHLYKIVGEASVKELVKTAIFITKTIFVAGLLAILGFLGIKHNVIKP